MDDRKQTRGDDAADNAPWPDQAGAKKPPSPKQDAPNYDETDKGQAIKDEDVNSANDE